MSAEDKIKIDINFIINENCSAKFIASTLLI